MNNILDLLKKNYVIHLTRNTLSFSRTLFLTFRPTDWPLRPSCTGFLSTCMLSTFCLKFVVAPCMEIVSPVLRGFFRSITPTLISVKKCSTVPTKTLFSLGETGTFNFSCGFLFGFFTFIAGLLIGLDFFIFRAGFFIFPFLLVFTRGITHTGYIYLLTMEITCYIDLSV